VLVGICAGAFTINGLSSAQQNELGDYIGGFFNQLSDQSFSTNGLLSTSLVNNYRMFLLIFVAGMTIIGIPFVYVFVGLNAYVTGFTIGFFIKIHGFKGVLYSLASILPSELFILPAIILISVNAIIFSKGIIKQLLGKNLNRVNFKESLLSYLFITGFCAMITFIGILIESYVSPVIIKLMLPILT
jgi:stage II sporulation protein M